MNKCICLLNHWLRVLDILVFSVNSVDPGQTPRFSTSSFGQRCWPRCVSRVRWVLMDEIIHYL